MATMGKQPPKNFKHAMPSVPLGGEGMRTPEEVAHEFKDKLHQYARTGPTGTTMGTDEAMPAIYWPICMLVEMIARDRREQAALVLPLVKWALNERPTGKPPFPPNLEAAEQWLAEAERAAAGQPEKERKSSCR